MQNLFPLFWLIALTLLSGVCDAQGFVYAARMWQGGALVKAAALRSLLYFLVGMALYLYSLRFLQQFSVVSPELQSLFWFSVTLIGVAVINGRAAQWSSIDRLVAVLVLCGIGWLLLRTGG
ncbi:MAG: hypothetical protein HYR56_21265 [Acidobacteria bacterium]|nr:hypothetical protein [Acidobacteriota bacterium]MBI3427576.1 hypothetical protein [Acidobacteriota bacterium]